jgi:hypothetical protein
MCHQDLKVILQVGVMDMLALQKCVVKEAA